MVNNSGYKTIVDPYAALAANIPPNTCSPSGSAAGYPQEPTGRGTALPATNQWSGTASGWGTTKVLCGDQQLTGNFTVPAGTTVVIENGQLDTNGYSFTLNGGSVIFTGPTVSGLSPTYAPTGGGTLNITAPTSGTWSGVALYQDPALTTGVDISAAGNSPTWNIVGLDYFPNANVEIKGAVGKGGVGGCMGLVVGSLLIDGTGDILDNNHCAAAGLALPSAGSRAALVQ